MYNFSRVFRELLANRSDKGSKWLQIVGSTAFATGFGSFAVLQMMKKTTEESANYVLTELLESVFAIGFLIGVACLLVALLYHLGNQSGHSTFADAVRHTLKRTFFLIVLPAIVLLPFFLLLLYLLNGHLGTATE